VPKDGCNTSKPGSHSSTRAAMIYQHATCDRDDAIATALNALIESARGDLSA